MLTILLPVKSLAYTPLSQLESLRAAVLAAGDADHADLPAIDAAIAAERARLATPTRGVFWNL